MEPLAATIPSCMTMTSDYPSGSSSKRIGGLQLIVYLHHDVCNVFDKLSPSTRPV